MEADWEIEVGGDAAVIDAHWDGFIDLRKSPQDICRLAEAVGLPALASALLRLNDPSGRLFTSKCDVWLVEGADPVDPDELNASADNAVAALACYIDLQPLGDLGWSTAQQAEEWCRRLCGYLRSRPLNQCRVDLVVRSVVLIRRRAAFAVTAYLTACGPTHEQANEVLSSALTVFADSVLRSTSPTSAPA